MAVKTYTKQEQAKIDARTKEVADAKSSEKRNKMLMYIGGCGSCSRSCSLPIEKKII